MITRPLEESIRRLTLVPGQVGDDLDVLVVLQPYVETDLVTPSM